MWKAKILGLIAILGLLASTVDAHKDMIKASVIQGDKETGLAEEYEEDYISEIMEDEDIIADEPELAEVEDFEEDLTDELEFDYPRRWKPPHNCRKWQCLTRNRNKCVLTKCKNKDPCRQNCFRLYGRPAIAPACKSRSCRRKRRVACYKKCTGNYKAKRLCRYNCRIIYPF